MKRVVIVAVALLFVFYGIRATYRAVSVPQLPTAPVETATPRPRGPLPMLAFAAGPDARYLAVFHRDDHTATLLTADGPRQLQATPAASGARYEGQGCMLWTKGEDITLEIDGQPVPETRVTGRQAVLERHWRDGVLLLATGQEPDWFLTVGADGAELIIGGYDERHELATGVPDLPAGLVPSGTWTLGTAPDTATLTIEANPCADTMSGAPYPATARLEFGGRSFDGCALGLR